MSSVEVTWICPKTQYKSNAVQFFLAYLLVLLASYFCFYLAGSMSLIIGLVIGNKVLIAKDIVISLSEKIL